LAFGEDAVWDFTKIADKTEPGKNFQGVKGDVNFPPIKTLASAGHVVVVVVVPPFAECDESEKPIVLAGVGCREAPLAENVRERIDGESAVPEERGAEEETPGKQRQTTDEKHTDGERGWRNEVILVQPAKLGKFGEVADVVEARLIVPIRKNPADMGPPETEKRRRVEIVFLIGVTVVMTVVSGPPENAFLRGGHRHPGDDELEPASGLERPMREVAVVTGGDEEHAHFIGEQADERVIPLKGKEKDAECGEMNE